MVQTVSPPLSVNYNVDLSKELGASEYFQRTESIAGVKVSQRALFRSLARHREVPDIWLDPSLIERQDMRFQALMPDVSLIILTDDQPKVTTLTTDPTLARYNQD